MEETTEAKSTESSNPESRTTESSTTLEAKSQKKGNANIFKETQNIQTLEYFKKKRLMVSFLKFILH